MGRVDGKVAIVTGFAMGQGRAHAVRLGEEGAAVVGVDLAQDYDCVPYPMATETDVTVAEHAVRATGAEVAVHHADVRDRQQMEKVVADTLERFGRLDIIVANAGICPATMPFWAIPERQWDTVFDVNAKGVWNTVAAAAPALIDAHGGSVIMTSSLLGIRGGANLADYSAAKHAVIGLVRSMALELAPHMVRVNGLCPNSVDTNMINNEAIFRAFRPDLANPARQDTIDVFKSLQPMPVPWLDPRDIANAMLFLASDDARYITGAILPVDLGGSIR